MYLNNEELEYYWCKYCTEALPKNIALEDFCKRLKISYKALENYRRQLKNKIQSVEVVGLPQTDSKADEQGERKVFPDEDTPTETTESKQETRPYDRFTSCMHRQRQQQTEEDTRLHGVRFMISIRATNGLQVYRKNMDLATLKNLVQNLDALC